MVQVWLEMSSLFSDLYHINWFMVGYIMGWILVSIIITGIIVGLIFVVVNY